MKNVFLQKVLVALLLATAGHIDHAWAHTADAILDPPGTNAGATDLAQVNCYDDGSGPPHHLFVQIKDNSPPAPNMSVSIQTFKDGQMANTTDTVSGDATAGDATTLVGNNGFYYLSVSKTNVGTRSFTATYHCQTANNTHTGTDIVVFQGQ